VAALHVARPVDPLRVQPALAFVISGLPAGAGVLAREVQAPVFAPLQVGKTRRRQETEHCPKSFTWRSHRGNIRDTSPYAHTTHKTDDVYAWNIDVRNERKLANQLEPLGRSYVPLSEKPRSSLSKNNPFNQKLQLKIPLLNRGLELPCSKPGCRVSAIPFFVKYILYHQCLFDIKLDQISAISASYSRMNSFFTDGKRIGVCICHATRGLGRQEKITTFTSILYAFRYYLDPTLLNLGAHLKPEALLHCNAVH
jgi:hypothetical protein